MQIRSRFPTSNKQIMRTEIIHEYLHHLFRQSLKLQDIRLSIALLRKTAQTQKFRQYFPIINCL